MAEQTTTTPFWIKLFTSTINVAIIALMTLPIYLAFELTLWQTKLAFIGMSVVYAAVAMVIPGHRSPAMAIMGVRWKEKYDLKTLGLYAVLYLISLSTVLFHIWFPFDLLAINLLLVQLPCVLITGTTLHGKLAGGVTTVRTGRGLHHGEHGEHGGG